MRRCRYLLPNDGMLVPASAQAETQAVARAASRLAFSAAAEAISLHLSPTTVKRTEEGRPQAARAPLRHTPASHSHSNANRNSWTNSFLRGGKHFAHGEPSSGPVDSLRASNCGSFLPGAPRDAQA